MVKYFLFILLVFSYAVSAQDTLTGKRELFTVNSTPVYAEEFKYVYKKNNVNNENAFTKDDINSYFDLFVNFKLKIEEAKSLGIDQEEEFQKELEGYLEQLKKPYLSENEVTKKLVQEAYDRYSEEIKASHILLNILNGDTLSAYNKALELKKKIEGGSSFESVAVQNSTDPSVKINKGNLGYFTSFQMVYPFETAAYSTAEGDISEPVRTKFGYHIIQVKDRRPTNGKVQVSHIMLRHKSDSASVRNKMFEIYEQANAGVSWDELVKQYSDDNNSKNTNGILRPFSVAQMPYEFQEAAFQLEDIGDISDPVMTKYGWHIMKLVKRTPIEPFDKLEPIISAKIEKDPRSQLNEKVLIQRLKKENGFSEDQNTWKEVSALADEALVKAQWNPNIKLMASKTLFKVGDKDFSVENFVEFVQEEKKTSSSQPQIYLSNLYNNFQREQIIAYEVDLLEEKYIDYKMLVKEYQEGIMLFQLMEEKVWNRAVEDSIGLLEFYNRNKGDYSWGQRAKTKIYSSSDRKIIEQVKNAIENDDSVFLSKENLYKKFNSGPSVTLQIESGLFEKGVIEVLDQVVWEKGIHEITYAGQSHVVLIDYIEAPRPKELNEAKGAVISDYQGELEVDWIKELKKKYTVRVNKAVLNDTYEELAK